MQIENIHTSPIIGAWLAGVPVRVWVKRAMNPAFEQCRQPTFKERVAISLRISCWLASRVVCVSNAVAQELLGMGVSPAKVGVQCNPRRLEMPDPAFNRDAVRKSWGCCQDDVVIVTLGRATPVKGWDILVKAFAPVARAVPHARLVLVGDHRPKSDEPFHRQLMEFILENKLANKIVFPGYMGDVGQALRAADIFVMPSRSEGCSAAPVEALEAGLPVVVTRVGHCHEVVQHGVNGFIVERCNIDAMAGALLELAADEAKRTLFSSNARVPDHVPSLEQYAARMVSEYEALLSFRQSLAQTC
jgi:glycosyltransferase involved in cell wall biosynthesis